ncbi:acyl--CoA ligase [Maribius pontilimi]|uniref:Acyl--CoA ligase n=1 Tax=Palleronia pontilimi TaxID=1964209 RepID=A0A934IBP7_9RHOB|nr:class I adenylate-forming enzyme family protein [Palleronia pontilimi]MBJ3764183.1 acyl--CoA ligase [Palleronia pontilimi]
MTRLQELIDRHAEQRPDSPALRDTLGHRVDFAGYKAATEEAAALLRHAGVRPGDRVMVVAENCLAIAAMVFGASRLDAWIVPVNARMSASEIDSIRAHCTPRASVFTLGASDEAKAHAARAGADVADASFGHIAIATHEAEPDPDTEVAMLLYTTGTTGAPKGVMLTHDNLVFAGKASCDLRAMTARDRIYGALPLTHVFGLASMLTAAAVCGAEVQLETRFTPAALLEALQNGATVLPAVPQMHALLMEHTAGLGMDNLKDAKLRYVSSGAAPLDPAWKRKAEAFYGLPLQNGYGMTETTAGVSGTRNPIGTPDVSVGPPAEGVEVRLKDPNDKGVGEILVRGPNVMKGYYKAPDKTAEVMDDDGWLSTGDLGEIDADGNLHVVGRVKELIIRSGFNVYPPEVEAAINDHPDVVQCAVVGRPHKGNEQVLAFVQTAGDVTPDALRGFVADSLSNYKRPSAIFIVDELPAAATGKILKHKLLDTFADRIAEMDKE